MFTHDIKITSVILLLKIIAMIQQMFCNPVAKLSETVVCLCLTIGADPFNDYVYGFEGEVCREINGWNFKISQAICVVAL